VTLQRDSRELIESSTSRKVEYVVRTSVRPVGRRSCSTSRSWVGDVHAIGAGRRPAHRVRVRLRGLHPTGDGLQARAHCAAPPSVVVRLIKIAS
jgi:hypothetical protein